MTNGRYETRRGWRETMRPRDEDRRSWQEGDERGFFERAGDEIASWFGDDDGRRRRERDEWSDEAEYRRPRAAERDYGRAPASERDWGRTDYGRFERSSPRFRDEGYRRPYTGRFAGRGFEGGRDLPREDRFDRGTSQRDFTGQASGLHDPHYSEWRRRQIDALDRDYDEYRRENESRFENEFGQWRETRATKRQMLGSVREQMTVLGSDGEHVGTVDKVRGDRIVLTKNDSDDGRHHLISCSMVENIEGDSVKLNVPAEEAKAKSMAARTDRERALFEREEDDHDGPHMLNRSFSGTY